MAAIWRDLCALAVVRRLGVRECDLTDKALRRKLAAVGAICGGEMHRWTTMVFVIAAGLIESSCAFPRAAQPTPMDVGTSVPPILATAPPPILYPPHDPAATYPVIRTWEEVLTFQPYPYLEPIPASEPTEIDGVYGKLDPSPPQWWRCARCADFKLAGGNWRIMLHEGTLLMYYEVTGFSTVSSYIVYGDHLKLSNDPHCPYETGEYTWSLADGDLALVEVSDTCAIHLRAENLTHQPWASCQPPNPEAGITDHWIRPPGCG